MEPKKYQRRVLDEVKTYLLELAKQQAAGNKHAALDAWENIRVPGHRYLESRNKLESRNPKRPPRFELSYLNFGFARISYSNFGFVWGMPCDTC